MVSIILSGCMGHMGQMVTKAASQTDDVKIVAGVDKASGDPGGYPLYDDISKCAEKADAVIDFSAAAAVDSLLEYGRKTKTPLILCATGYSDEQLHRIDEASKDVAIFRSANMSFGISVLSQILKKNAAKLAEAGFDIEILEKHHNLKKDAPSGTALLLADAISSGLDEEYPYVYDRSKRSEKRPHNEIGISAIRGGTIPGDHDVIFAGEDEVVTFSHRAYSKAVFAKGAVQAARFMKGKGPGRYDMQAVVEASG